MSGTLASGTLLRAALCDELRAARLMVIGGQRIIERAPGGLRDAPAPFYLRRAADRLAQARAAL